MRNRNLPFATVVLALLMFIYSSYVAVDLTGSFWGKLKIVQLEGYGGVRLEHLADLELWRLLAAQLIHVKPVHMIFNFVSFLLLGTLVERHIGSFKLFAIWFLGGALGTVVSTLFVEYPWNLGTGSSQAILSIAGVGLVLLMKKVDRSNWMKVALCLAVLPALMLDLIYAHYPKPGHILSFVIGVVLAWLLLKAKVRQANR